MRKRSTAILQRILKKPTEEWSLQRLIADYHISEKTLRNDIQEIEEFIGELGLDVKLIYDNLKLRLDIRTDSKQISDAIYAMDFYQYKMCAEERKIYIIVTLLLHEGYYSMQQLADELYVTRNTIVNDCRLVETYLKELGIHFIAKSKKGIKIEMEGNLFDTLLIDLFQKLLASVKDEETYLVQRVVKKLKFTYSVKDVVYYMNRFMKDSNIIFAKDAIFEMAICIFVLLNSIKQTGIEDEDHEKTMDSIQLDMIGSMINYVAEQIGVMPFGKASVLSIEKQILRRSQHPQIQSINDFELYGIICHFLLEISKEIDEDIQSDDLLVESLISHMKGMNNCAEIDYDWDLSCEESEDFLYIKKIAEGKFCILEKYFQYTMTSKMKDSIIIHICAALLRRRQNSYSVGVIISCPGSMATSKYLEAQIRGYFNFYIVATLTTRQVIEEKRCLEEADFVISTVPIEECKLPVIVVSPLITVEDINKIQNLTYKQKKNGAPDIREKYPILSKIYEIYETGNERKIEYLNRELQQILEDSFYIESRMGKGFALTDMLKLKYIKIIDDEMEWHQAMKIASADLVRDGYFDERYVQEAIYNVEEYGSYIIVNQGIALAHASKENGVYEDGISLLVARNGIVFDEGYVVNLLFFFSQKGETDYVNLFREIIQLGKESEDIEKICSLPDAMEVYRAIWEILSRD